jgi:uncharacterized protein (DUF952 family)
MTRVYKLLTRAEWRAAEAQGVFEGSAVDLADGFIHFSTAAQAPETGRRYFAGVADLVIVGFEAEALGDATVAAATAPDVEAAPRQATTCLR